MCRPKAGAVSLLIGGVIFSVLVKNGFLEAGKYFSHPTVAHTCYAWALLSFVVKINMALNRRFIWLNICSVSVALLFSTCAICTVSSYPPSIEVHTVLLVAWVPVWTFIDVYDMKGDFF